MIHLQKHQALSERLVAAFSDVSQQLDDIHVVDLVDEPVQVVVAENFDFLSHDFDVDVSGRFGWFHVHLAVDLVHTPGHLDFLLLVLVLIVHFLQFVEVHAGVEDLDQKVFGEESVNADHLGDEIFSAFNVDHGFEDLDGVSEKVSFQVHHAGSWQVAVWVKDDLSFSSHAGFFNTDSLLEVLGILVVWQVDDLQWDGFGDFL